MHQRPPKETAIDVILYERDLLRYCANTVDSREARWKESPSDETQAEYYLTIECFLLRRQRSKQFTSMSAGFAVHCRARWSVPERKGGIMNELTLPQSNDELTKRLRDLHETASLCGRPCRSVRLWRKRVS
jgi:hypothetical protein